MDFDFWRSPPRQLYIPGNLPLSIGHKLHELMYIFGLCGSNLILNHASKTNLHKIIHQKSSLIKFLIPICLVHVVCIVFRFACILSLFCGIHFYAFPVYFSAVSPLFVLMYHCPFFTYSFSVFGPMYFFCLIRLVCLCLPLVYLPFPPYCTHFFWRHVGIISFFIFSPFSSHFFIRHIGPVPDVCLYFFCVLDPVFPSALGIASGAFAQGGIGTVFGFSCMVTFCWDIIFVCQSSVRMTSQSFVRESYLIFMMDC